MRLTDISSKQGQSTHMPLPEPRMAGNAEPEAQASGKDPLMLLLLSARMASFGSALLWPHAGGSVPLIWLPVSVSSLHRQKVHQHRDHHTRRALSKASGRPQCILEPTQRSNEALHHLGR